MFHLLGLSGCPVQEVMKHFRLREQAGADPQTYALGLKEVWEVRCLATASVFLVFEEVSRILHWKALCPDTAPMPLPCKACQGRCCVCVMLLCAGILCACWQPFLVSAARSPQGCNRGSKLCWKLSPLLPILPAHYDVM